MASKDMIPTGLPYGERQNVERFAAAAEIPTDSATIGAPPGAQPPQRAPAEMASPSSIDDPLMVVSPFTPLSTVPTRSDVLYNIATRARNPLAQLVAQRLMADEGA